MPGLTSSWRRALIAMAIVAADAVCVYFALNFDARPQWAFVALCGLLLIFIIAAVKGQFVVELVQLALLAACVLDAGTLAIEDGSADVKMRLTVTGLPKGETPQVVWSHPEWDRSRRVWVEEPWESVEADGTGNVFRSVGWAQMSIHSRLFSSSGGWYFGGFEDRLIVIVVGGKRFRFEARSIFGKYPVPRPEEFAATFDISDYLSGKKEPPGVDYPPDDMDASPIPPGEGAAPN